MFRYNIYNLFDWFFVLVTALIAWNGILFRDENGKSDIVRLLFGSISLLFCLRVLLVDILAIL